MEYNKNTRAEAATSALALGYLPRLVLSISRRVLRISSAVCFSFCSCSIKQSKKRSKTYTLRTSFRITDAILHHPARIVKGGRMARHPKTRPQAPFCSLFVPPRKKRLARLFVVKWSTRGGCLPSSSALRPAPLGVTVLPQKATVCKDGRSQAPTPSQIFFVARKKYCGVALHIVELRQCIPQGVPPVDN